MYTFVVHYTEIETDEEITRMIEIDMNVIDSPDEYKSAWRMATDRAIDLERKMNDNELGCITFDSIELLSC